MTAAQLVGRPYDEVFPAAARSIPGEHYRRVLRTGEPTQFELRSTVRADTILDVRAFPYADGVGVLFINRTEERALAQRLRGSAALEQALLIADHAAVLELNIRGGIVGTSKAFEQMTGFSAADLLRCRLADLLVPRGRAAVFSALEEVFAGRGPASASAVVLGKNGVETPIMLGLAAIDDYAQQPGVKVVVLRA
jgi:PAS domain S-box-containing protein